VLFVVFLWVPSLLTAYPSYINADSSGASDGLPTGLIFSCFMLAMTFGGFVFNLLLPFLDGDGSSTSANYGIYYFNILVYFISSVAMLIPVYSFNFNSMFFVSFLLLEVTVGMNNSVGATLRAQIYPENLQSSIMSIFRVPLNLLVVIGTSLANNSNSSASMQSTFMFLCACHVVSMCMQVMLLYFTKLERSSQDRKAKKE
jgi:MFS family permease